MRTRTKTISTGSARFIEKVYVQGEGYVEIVNISYPGTGPYEIEYMQDAGTKAPYSRGMPGNPRPTFISHYCNHRKVVRESAGGWSGFVFPPWGGSTYRQVTGDVMSYAYPNGSWYPTKPSVSYPSWETVWNAFTAEVYGYSKPQVLSLPSIVEVLELKNWIRLFGAKIRRISYFRTGRSDRMAEAQLGYRFGLKPLWEDLKNAAKLLQDTQDKLAFYAKASGNEVRISAAVPATYTIPAPPDPKTVVSYTTYSISKAFRRVTARVRADYNTSDMAATYDLIRGLGLNRLLSSTWELVPFSFIVDWFINIQSVVNQLDRVFSVPDKLVKLYSVTNVCESEFLSANFMLYSRLFSDDWSTSRWPMRSVGGVKAEWYLRVPAEEKLARDGLDLSGSGLNVNRAETLSYLCSALPKFGK